MKKHIASAMVLLCLVFLGRNVFTQVPPPAGPPDTSGKPAATPPSLGAAPATTNLAPTPAPPLVRTGSTRRAKPAALGRNSSNAPMGAAVSPLPTNRPFLLNTQTEVRAMSPAASATNLVAKPGLTNPPSAIPSSVAAATNRPPVTNFPAFPGAETVSGLTTNQPSLVGAQGAPTNTTFNLGPTSRPAGFTEIAPTKPVPPPVTNFPAFPGTETVVAPVKPTNETVLPAGTIRFPAAPLESVFKIYADLSGRTILRSPTLPPNNTITLDVQNDLTITEARQALDYVLALNNISMIPMGEKFVLAVPATQALQEAAAFSSTAATNLPEAAQFITQIVRLTNALPTELQPLLTPFSKLPGGIVPIDSSQILVLRDYAVNVKRMMELIARVDVYTEPDYKLEVIPIKYGKVEEIYPVMSSLIGGAGGGAPGAPTTPAARGTTTGRGGRRGMGRGLGTSPMGGPGMTPGTPGAMGPMGAQPGTTPGGSQSVFQRNLQAIVARAAGGETQILSDAKIIPDQRSNSLIVYANKKDMAMLTNIVAKLDVALAQVLIEAVVIDVTLSDRYSLGVSTLQNPRNVGKFTGTGGQNNGPGFLSSVTNLATGLPSGFSYFGTWAGDLQAAISAISANNTANVLQRPRITTTHAVPASFFSGSQVPYSGGSYGYGGYGGLYGGYPGTYVQFLQVGIGLDVTPFITPDGLVLMDITQTIQEFQGFVDVGGGQKAPQTTERDATSTVSVKNGETIILGGFIRSSRSKSYSGVPLLKDIPLLGNLFRSTSHDNSRSELLVLLRPTVLTNPEEASKAAQFEKERLPGVRRAEQEFTEEEQRILQKSKKKSKR